MANFRLARGAAPRALPWSTGWYEQRAERFWKTQFIVFVHTLVNGRYV